jgi:hypothetical protein
MIRTRIAIESLSYKTEAPAPHLAAGGCVSSWQIKSSGFIDFKVYLGSESRVGLFGAYSLPIRFLFVFFGRQLIS